MLSVYRPKITPIIRLMIDLDSIYGGVSLYNVDINVTMIVYIAVTPWQLRDTYNNSYSCTTTNNMQSYR